MGVAMRRHTLTGLIVLWIAFFAQGERLAAQGLQYAVSTDRSQPENVVLAAAPAITVRRFVREAEVRFLVTDSKGIPLIGLRPRDLRVFDNGVPVNNFTSFRRDQSAPTRIGILVDLSESILVPEQNQALMSVAALADILNAGDDAFVVGFSSKVRLLQPPTSDITAIQKSLVANPGRAGLTSLFDAIVDTCSSQYVSDENQRRILVLFSDGADNLSIHSAIDAVDEARRSGVAIYAVTSGKYSDGLKLLRYITRSTGGKIFLMPMQTKLQALMTALSGQSRGEYTLTFQPPTVLSGFHSIRIQIPGHTDTIVNSRGGYYLNPQLER